MQEFRKNRFAEGRPTNVVKELTGRESEDFETIARHFIDTSPYKKRNFWNRLTAMKKFLKLLLTKLPSKREQEALNQ
jgi:NAD(P)H dehydrogenase (quinone)